MRGIQFETMKIGIALPNHWGVEDPNEIIDLAVRAEERGFASVWTGEHVLNIGYVSERLGDKPFHHCLALLSGIASRTKRIALGTSIVVVPFHHPLDLAKYIATLDQISRGRVILGVGVGNIREEFDALGVPWEKRGAITDESLDILREVWTQTEASHSGARWSFKNVHTSPKPFGGRRVPIWVGGHSDASIRRTIRVGDGWHPTGITPQELREQVVLLREKAAEAGRDPHTLDVCMRFHLALDDIGSTESAMRSTVAGYDAPRVLEVASEFAEAGVTHLIYALNASDENVLSATVDALAKDVLPRFQGKTS